MGDSKCLKGPSTAARSKCSNAGTLVWKSCPKTKDEQVQNPPAPPSAPPKSAPKKTTPVLKGCDERTKAECEATPSLSKTKKCVWDATPDGYASCHAVAVTPNAPAPPSAPPKSAPKKTTPVPPSSPPPPPQASPKEKSEPAPKSSTSDDNGAVACDKIPGMRAATKAENQYCHRFKSQANCRADAECRWISLAAKSGGNKMCKPKCHKSDKNDDNSPQQAPAPPAQQSEDGNSTDQSQDDAPAPPVQQSGQGIKGCFDRTKDDCETSSGLSSSNKCEWDDEAGYCKAVKRAEASKRPKPCFARSNEECTASPSPLKSKKCMWENDACKSVAARRLI